MMAPGDELDIRGGGVVAVDTETLRAAEARLRLAATACEDIQDLLDRARRTLHHEGVWVFSPAAVGAQAGARCRRLADDLRAMADAYEVAELSAAASAAEAAGDTELARSLRGRALGIMAADPALVGRLAAAAVQWRTETTAALAGQYRPPTIPGTTPPYSAEAFAVLAGAVIGAVGQGAVPRGTRLTGAPAPVTVARLGASRTTAPASLAQLVDRIPQGEGRVRVERYTMPGGAPQFVLYSAGTAVRGGKGEAWDGASNLALYTRSRAASFDATMAAAADAGARPGDRVVLVGHSQGAMIASYVALSETYEVPLLVTFGDPVHADVGDGTLSVAVRHLDDPVSALADGGHPGTVGAEGSFVAARDAPATAFTGDGILGQHGLDSYRETARMLDVSPDPRMDAVRGRLGDLASADSVAAFVYGASRVGDAPAPGVSGSSSAGGG